MIRSYKNKDYEEVKKLLKNTNLFSEKFDTREAFLAKIKNDKNSILVKEKDSTVIAFVIFIFDPWNTLVYHLCVDPAHQRKGIGTKLLNQVEKEIQRRGGNLCTLFVGKENKEVIEFYKKNNWFYAGETFCIGKLLNNQVNE